MRVSFFLPVLFTLLCSAQLKPCYQFSGPDRRLSSQIPCDPSANVSACCAPGGSCATNFYCVGQGVGDTYNRVGGCTDESGSDPACPLPFLQNPSAWNWFSYDANTTDCGDGTFCMNPGNETCCFNHEGVKKITYHNTAPIPTVAEEWKTYYQDAGYSVPTATARRSTSPLLASKDISNIPPSATSTVHRQSLEVSPSPASQTSSTAVTTKPVSTSTSKTTISAGEGAIIGIASALGLFCAVGSLYLFHRSRAKRRAQPESVIQNRSAHYLNHNGLGHDVPSEMDATEGWPSSKAHTPVAHEIMTQDQDGPKMAEMSG